MRRQLRFRVWDLLHEEFTYFDLNGVREDGYVSHTSNSSGGYPFTEKEDAGNIFQYTGLKDKNGKEIYEGDIIDFVVFGHNDHDTRYRMQVKYLGSSFHLSDEKGPWPLEEIHAQDDELEVIGNIYENEELLKQPA